MNYIPGTRYDITRYVFIVLKKTNQLRGREFRLNFDLQAACGINNRTRYGVYMTSWTTRTIAVIHACLAQIYCLQNKEAPHTLPAGSRE